ncbi:MAG: rod shape-determining protein MreC [Actinomycetes bacterium]
MARGGGNRSRLLLVILLVTALFFVTLDLRGVSLTKGSRSVTQTILAPVQRTVSTIFSPVGRFFGDVKNFGKTNAELKQALATNKLLKSKLAENSDTKGQLAQLKSVLDLAGRGNYKVAAARVIARGSASSFSQTITIDAGSSSGIRSNMTVISQNGLIGVVKSTTSSTSIVLLLSDPSFKVGVRIARSQSVGVLSGLGSTEYSLVLLDPSGTIQTGDILLTNGSEGNKPFVPGVPVGVVVGADNSAASLTQTATVNSYANLNDLGVVSVILSAPTTAPSKPLLPTPNPTVTVYVTPAPSPVLSPTPSASPTKKK